MNEKFILRLYVAGQTPKSLTAFSNLKKICEERLKGEYTIEVIDLKQQPDLAKTVKKLPPPVKRIIGDLSNTEKVLVGLDLIEK